MAGIIDINSVEAQFGYSISLLFGMLTPILNPILYSLFNENVKKHLLEKCGFLRCFEARNEASSNGETVEMKGMANKSRSNGNIPDADQIEAVEFLPSQTDEVTASGQV